MASPCSGDPVVCIDFIILFIGEFLKDWTTLAMLAILLGLLLRLRADRQRAAEAAYAMQIGVYEEKLKREADRRSHRTWHLEGDRGDGSDQNY